MQILVWVLVALQVLDLGTTWLGLNYGAQEGNPFGIWLLGFGFHGLVIAKAIATAAAIGMAYVIWRKRPKMARVGLAVNIGIMALVVIFNTFTVLSHMG